jgi:hypothetical protein
MSIATGITALLAPLVLGCAAFGQTPPREPDTLQALLAEVRQLRQSIDAMMFASQRIQIALYGAQLQDAAVARAMQAVERVRNTCGAEEREVQHTVAEIQRMDSGVASTQGVDAKQLQARVTELQKMLEMQRAASQSCQASQAEAEGQLRNEQTKLLEIQDKIAKLDRVLEQHGSGGR